MTQSMRVLATGLLESAQQAERQVNGSISRTTFTASQLQLWHHLQAVRRNLEVLEQMVAPYVQAELSAEQPGEKKPPVEIAQNPAE